MFYLHQSNRLEILAAMLVDRLAEPTGDAFVTDVVVTQSPDMARWLSLQLADHHGICANVRFPFPATFIWELMRAVLPEVPRESPFDRPQLIWRLMLQLQSLPDDDHYAPLRHYLDPADDDRRRFDLAQKIADVFDQYMVYRPDWIARWEAGQGAVTGDAWQASLWRAVFESVPADHRHHRAGLLQALLKRLDPARLQAAGLPSRIMVFAPGAMPPAYLAVFKALGEVLDVHLLLLNPSREFWGNILSERARARLPDQASLALETDNPLLAAWGQQGREFFDLLLGDEPPQADSVFVAPGHGRLLYSLQQDILDLDSRRQPQILAADDDSVRIAACHSPLREVEVLQDTLLGLLADHPDMTPADIVVMTPDIETYAPLIDAVFGRFEGDDPRRLPYAVADRGLRAESPLLEAFFALLALPGGRLENRLVMDLLEQPAIAERRGFSAEDLDILRHWVEATAIKWGADAEAQAALGASASGVHSWRAGLDRLLLGLALPAAEQRLFHGILPFDDIEGSQAQLLGRLAETLDLFIAWQDRLQARLTPQQWSERLGQLLADFFGDSGEEAEVLVQLHAALERLREQAQAAGFEQPLSLEVVSAWLRGQLDGLAVPGRYLGQGITFCRMVPLRNLPFRVVCLLGMSDGQYPRLMRPVDFDLMTRYGQQGDRSRREDDRYLFLEALLSARDCLYISHVGASQRDNAAIPPSVLVSELLDVIDRGYRFEDSQDPPSRRLWRRQSLQPFAAVNFDPDQGRPSHAHEWLAASRESAMADAGDPPLFDAPLPPPEPQWRQVAVDALLEFYANPARYLLRRRLGITLREEAGPLDPREPFDFEADYLAKLELNRTLMTHLQTDLGPQESLGLLQAKGMLPPGRAGERLHAEAYARVADVLEGMNGAEPLPPLPVSLTLGDFELVGWLREATPAGLELIDPGNYHGRGLMALWIRHLLLCALAPEGVPQQSRIRFAMAQKTPEKCAQLVPVQQPLAHLQILLEHYWQGLHQPLPLFPKSSLRAADGKDASSSWYGSRQHRGECENAYYRAAFRGRDPLAEPFGQIAETLYGPLLEHLRGCDA